MEVGDSLESASSKSADIAVIKPKDKCPSCSVPVEFEWIPMEYNEGHLEQFVSGWRFSDLDFVRIWVTKCPLCSEIIVDIQRGGKGDGYPFRTFDMTRVVPKGGIHEIRRNLMEIDRAAENKYRQLPPEIPGDLAQDYREATQILDISPKASAALARRCLQHFCNEYLGAKDQNLSRAIEEVISSGQLTHLNRAFDAVRELGNMAAHPTKNVETGLIVDVAPGEAEAILEVLSEAFDAHFAAPARAEAIRAKINAKLIEAGRKPLS